MNTHIIVKMAHISYADWKREFDADKEIHSQFMRNTLVGKVDDNTALISTEVYNPEPMQAFMDSQDFMNMEAKLGLTHTVFSLAEMA